MPSNRDLAAELAHLKAWWASRPRLSEPGISQDAGYHRDRLPSVLRGAHPPTAQLLDKVYVALLAYDYSPLEEAPLH